MVQLVILSGKGGAGKTSVAAAFSHLAAESPRPMHAVLADADVEAANLELVLAPTIIDREDFVGGQLARIDQGLCNACGECVEVCRYSALQAVNGIYRVDPMACEGCAACAYACPYAAISMEDHTVGQWCRSLSRFGPLLHASLRPAQENSGKLVALIRERARRLALYLGYDLVLVDGPPGIGCPVIASISGVNLALIVAEPTVAGQHDLRRILETAEHFGVRSLVCINKADLYAEGTEALRDYCREVGVEIIGVIPYDLTVTEAMVQGEPVTVYRPDSAASLALKRIWVRLLPYLEQKFMEVMV